MDLLVAILLTLGAVIGTTSLHYEAIRRLDRFARRATRVYPTLLVVISGLIALHLVEIGAYAMLFALASGPLDIGDFSGASPRSALGFFYYAAEAYASLGYSDSAPTGEMRLVSAITPLNGILLLAWSGSFLFSLVEDWRGRNV